MKRLFLIGILLVSVFIAKAEDYFETYNVLSDDYVVAIQDAQIIRQINGGTVITPIFDETCPKS